MKLYLPLLCILAFGCITTKNMNTHSIEFDGFLFVEVNNGVIMPHEKPKGLWANVGISTLMNEESAKIFMPQDTGGISGILGYKTYYPKDIIMLDAPTVETAMESFRSLVKAAKVNYPVFMIYVNFSK